jgi:hypothetical protein
LRETAATTPMKVPFLIENSDVSADRRVRMEALTLRRPATRWL